MLQQIHQVATRIDFGTNADGSSGSITIGGVDDADLSSIDLFLKLLHQLLLVHKLILIQLQLLRAMMLETFVYDATWDGDEVVGSDGDVTITGFSLSSDKLLILTSGDIPNGYDRSQFENNSAGTQQIVC